MIPFMPMDESILSAVLNYFEKCAVYTSALVGVIFLGRAVLLHLSFAGSAGFGALLKDTASYFVLLLLFPKIFLLANEICAGLASKFSWNEPTTITGAISDLSKAAQMSHWSVLAITKIGPYAVAYIGQAIATVLLGILVAIGPIMILVNTMWSLNGGSSAYFKALVVLLLWPFCWNMLGAIGQEVAAHQSVTSLMSVVFRFSVVVMQLLSPFFAYSLFSSFSTSGALQKARAIYQAAPAPVPKSTVSFKREWKKPPRFNPGGWL